MARTTIIKMEALRSALELATQPGQKWSKRALSLAAGMGPDTVRDILSGKSRNPNPLTVLALAELLELPPVTFLRMPEEEGATLPTVPIIGVAEVGVWREKPFVDEDAAEKFPGFADGTVAIKRFAVRVADLSMDEMFIPGDIVLCDYARDNNIVLSAGEVIVVSRMRANLHEVTIKTIRQDDANATFLSTRATTAENMREIRVTFEDDYVAFDDEGSFFAIIGVARGVYRPIKGLGQMRDSSRK